MGTIEAFWDNLDFSLFSHLIKCHGLLKPYDCCSHIILTHKPCFMLYSYGSANRIIQCCMHVTGDDTKILTSKQIKLNMGWQNSVILLNIQYDKRVNDLMELVFSLEKCGCVFIHVSVYMLWLQLYQNITLRVILHFRRDNPHHCFKIPVLHNFITTQPTFFPYEGKETEVFSIAKVITCKS